MRGRVSVLTNGMPKRGIWLKVCAKNCHRHLGQRRCQAIYLSIQRRCPSIEGTVREASYEGKDDAGNWMCDAVVYYSNALFIANFSVQPSGMIEMLDDEPIAADLPIKIDAPVA